MLLVFILYFTPVSEGTVKVGQDFLCNILYYCINNKSETI